MYSEKVKRKFLHILQEVKQRVELNGKDFTHQQFAEIFNVSRKTFSEFYSGELMRFDLLFQLATMYEFDIILIESEL